MKRNFLTAAWLAVLTPLLVVPRAHASVTVYGNASSTGPLVNVSVFADITGSPIVSHCCKVFYDPATLRVVSATRNAAAWTLFDGARPLAYPGPDASRPGEVLFTGAKLDARSPLAGVLGNRVLLGTIAFARNSSSTPSFTVRLGRAGEFANFVTTNGTTIDAYPGEVTFAGVSPDAADRDLDGLGDAWETQFFGNPRNAFYSDDSDRDGANNLAEQTAGSDPTNAASALRLTVTRHPDGALLQWPSASGRVYEVEASDDLKKFVPLVSEIRATPPLNSLTISSRELGHALFFRLRVETAAP